MKKIDKEKLMASIVSSIANPFIVIIFTLVLGNLELIKKNFEQAVIFLIINATLPFLFYVYELISHKENWYHFASISQRKRYLIYLSAIFSSLVSTILFSYTHQNTVWVYNSMMLAVLFSIFYMLNRYIDKLSFHAGAFALSMIYLTDKVRVFFAVFLAFLPIICWARIKLHKLTWFQLMLGSVIGMFIGILSWTF